MFEWLNYLLTLLWLVVAALALLVLFFKSSRPGEDSFVGFVRYLFYYVMLGVGLWCLLNLLALCHNFYPPLFYFLALISGYILFAIFCSHLRIHPAAQLFVFLLMVLYTALTAS